MASSAPPAPPPPPPQFSAPKVLAPGGRAPANRDSKLGAHPAQPAKRPPFAAVYPETLQHAAASLRKTEYGESLLSCDTQPGVGIPNQLSSRGHWKDFSEYEKMAEHQAGAEIHAPHHGANQSVPIGVERGYSIPVIAAQNSPASSRNAFAPLAQNSSYSYSSYTSSSSVDPREHVLPSAYTNGGSAFNPPIPANTFSPSAATSNSKSPAVSAPFVNHPNGNSARASPNNNRWNSQSSPQRVEVICDPQLYIRQYAMNTPASSLVSPPDASKNFSSSSTKTVITTTTTIKNGATPPPAQSSTPNFAKELRNSSLTERQKYSNQLQTPIVQDRKGPDAIQSLYRETQKYTALNPDPVNALIKDMEYKLRTGHSAVGQDFCTKCGSQIIGDVPGVTALGNAYHVTCFTCDECQKQLAGCSFYSVDGKNLCQVDYMNSLEKCEKCATPITQKILRAMGKPFHPECFICPACNKSLDGIPFTVDKESQAYCLDCYHERFSPRCAACLKAIAPIGSETEVARVIAMDRSYHIECYRCEDCGLKLNSKVEGQGCYPLENHLFCKNCNLNRLKNIH